MRSKVATTTNKEKVAALCSCSQTAAGQTQRSCVVVALDGATDRQVQEQQLAGPPAAGDGRPREKVNYTVLELACQRGRDQFDGESEPDDDDDDENEVSHYCKPLVRTCCLPQSLWPSQSLNLKT